MPRIDLHCHVFPPAYRDQLTGPLPPPPVDAGGFVASGPGFALLWTMMMSRIPKL